MIAIKTNVNLKPHRAKADTRLSREDQAHLRAYERRCQLLRDRVNSVSQGYHTGVYIVGRPGTGKTHVVQKSLDATDASYIFRNSRMTPMGLFAELESHPEHTIVLDDVSCLFNQPPALQILLAALGGQPGQPRLLCYCTKNRDERGKSFKFGGGIIAISNLPLRRDPLADALVSRVAMLEHEPPHEELAAVMRNVASQGFEDLTPVECREAVEFVIEESRTNEYRLDLRCMVKSFSDYRQFKHGHAISHWTELVRSSMRQILNPANSGPLSKQDQIELECEQVRKLMAMYPGDTKRQMRGSGLKKTTFYDRRRMVRASSTGSKMH